MAKQNRIADLIYENGKLKAPAKGKSWPAVTGPHKNGALPVGWYKCHTFQNRSNKPMVRDGVGFSIHLTPDFKTTRKKLRIHPDGNDPGTLGCIGITDKVKDCKTTFEAMFPTKTTVKWLNVRNTLKA